MKKYLAGLLTGLLITGLVTSALAISGRMTIDVDPINVQVNGEVFQPTDVNGKEVPVFAYQGTTYAPLRALAEAYGLEVGYDAAANMATVTDPDAKPQQPTTPDTTAKLDYSDWSAEDEAVGNIGPLEYISIALVEVNGKQYTTYDYDRIGIQMHYFYSTINGITEVFANDVSVTDQLNPTAWNLQYILRLCLMDDYDLIETTNPFLPEALKINTPDAYLSGYLTCGVESTKYMSETKSYTPQWIEYKGVRVYNSEGKDGISVEGDVLRYNSNLCVNDLLDKFGIDKQVSIKSVGELNCLVITDKP